MKKRILVLVALAALFLMALSGAAMAEDGLIQLTMDLSATRFAGPAEVTVTITVTNTDDEAMPGPLALYYPTGKIIEEFGTPTLAAGESRTWEGVWTVTEDQIRAGKVTFGMQYSYLDDEGEVARKTKPYYRAIEDAGAVAQVQINRYISPSMARNGQKVSVVYEVVNTGSISVTDVVIKEALSKTNGKIDEVKPGERAEHTFTVTMAKKDLTSSASISYKAGGKTYTETIEGAKIKYGDVKLAATLTADKKGGAQGDTVKLTLTLKNTGKENYENITVTDPSLGVLFTGLTVEAGKSSTHETTVTIDKSASYQFAVTATSAGATVETATERLTITAVDPSKVVTLSVYAEVDKPVIYILPDVVKFTVHVTNTSSVNAENVTVSASGVDLYTFESIPAGETRTFVRDVRVEMQGNFRFDARIANQLGDTDTFYSELIPIMHATPTAPPTSVPLTAPTKPEREELPADAELPAYLVTAEKAMAIGQWVFLGIGAIAVLLILVGAAGRAKNAAKSAQASDHLERDGYRDYTQAVPAKKRHMMPEESDADVDEEYHGAPAAEEAPVEAPAEEGNPEAVNDAMAQLYPEAAPEENATYNRRRKAEDK